MISVLTKSSYFRFFCIIVLAIILPVFSKTKISGMVFDSEGKMPLAGIELKVDDQEKSIFTDLNGRYTLDSFEGKSVVLVLKGSGYAETEITLTLNGPLVEKDIYLEKSTSIKNKKTKRKSDRKVFRGIIRDSLSGEVLAGANVVLKKPEVSIFTNRQGEFTISGIEHKRKSIRVIIDAGEYISREFKITLDSDTIFLSCSLLPENSKSSSMSLLEGIKGRVIDSLRGHGLSGALITMNNESQYTDENGSFTFKSVKNGTFTVKAEMPDYLPYTSSFEIKDGLAGGITIKLIPQTSANAFLNISGCVKDTSGIAISYCAAFLDGSSVKARTDSTGYFMFEAVPFGHYTLIISKSGFSPFVLSDVASDTSLNITLKTDTMTSSERKSFSLASRTSMTGQVIDEEGFPIEGASIGEGDTVLARTGPDGSFLIEDLEQRRYAIIVSANGYRLSDTFETEIMPGENKIGQVKMARSDLKVKTGRIFGLVKDKNNDEIIPGAIVSVEKTKIEVYSDLSGIYRISNLKPGTYRINFQSRGYQMTQSEDLTIEAGETREFNIALAKDDVEELERMSVQATMVQNTGASLLKERQNAVSFTDAIGGVEISRSGAGNAAEAMKNVTGATVVGSKYVFIRGLGEKYTITTLNGTPLPSPDPDKKAVNMDLFPSAMIENITVHKTATASLPGDWAGGIVDIKTKNFPEKLTISIGASGSANEATLSDENLSYEGGKFDWLGFDDGSRKIPKIFESYSKIDIDSLGNYFSIPFSSSAYAQRLQNGMMDTIQLLNQMVNSFDTVFAPEEKRAPLNQSYSLSIGNSISLFEKPVGFYAGLTYSNKYDITIDGIKRSYQLISEGAEPVIWTDMSEDKGKNTVLWGILGKASLQPADDHVLTATYMYTRNASDESSIYKGYYRYYMGQREPGDTFVSMRLHYTQRALNYFQPEGTHDLQIGIVPFKLNWTGTYTSTSQDEPNLRDIGYRATSLGIYGTGYEIQTNYPEPSHKFRNLDESALSLKAAAHFPFYQWSNDSATFSAGGFFNHRSRKTRERAFYYRTRLAIQKPDNTIPPEFYFNSQYRGIVFREDSTQTWGIGFRDDSQDPAQWDGNEDVFGGYVQLEVPINSSLLTTAGLRYERTDMFGASIVERYRDSSIAEMDYHDLLPSISAVYSLSENMKFRGAYGRTLVRPAMREKAKFLTESFTGGSKFYGNRLLERSLINNYDLRWEWFPEPGELLTASAFLKQIAKPIEITFLDNDVFQPANSDSSALIAGLELEFRKNLDMIELLRHFQISSNLTYAWSRIGLDDKTKRNPAYMPDEPLSRPFQGLSPYVINLNFTYENPERGIDFSLLYNHFGKRLSDLTIEDVPYLWEKSQHLLNITYNQKILKKFSFKSKITNLLSLTDAINTDNIFIHEYNGKEYVVRSEKSDISYQAGISYTF